jgi:hypothetical protein
MLTQRRIDPPQTERSIAAAKAHNLAERLGLKDFGLIFDGDNPVRLANPSKHEYDEQNRRRDGIHTLMYLVEAFDIKTVQTWLKNIAAQTGTQL